MDLPSNFNPTVISMIRTSLRPSTVRSTTLLAATLTAALAGACDGPQRPDLTPEQFTARSKNETVALKEIQFGAADLLLKRAATIEPGESRATLDILAISGGGDWGAFGAGFLVGWGEVANPADRRPTFDAVTGVSTGALLAPFAFLGTQADCETVNEFYRNPKSNWIDERGLLFFMPSNPSFMTIPGLQEDIQRTADDAFIERVAEQCRAGRTLIVSATDIDLGRQRFWNVGEEACLAKEKGSKRVHSMMLASSAIPVVFPPVDIDDGLFVDGGITANVLVRLDTRNPRGFLHRWKAEHPGEPWPKVRYWVIFNNQLSHIPTVVQRRWPGVLSPTMETVIRSATLSQLDLLATEADFANEVFGADVEMRVVSIPDSWRPPVAGPFKEETMRALSDMGREMGRNPASWQLWAAPGRTGPLPPHVP